ACSGRVETREPQRRLALRRNEQLVRRAPNLNVALFVVDQHVRSVRTECRGWKRCGRGARSIDVKRADRCSVGGEHLQLAVSIKDQKPFAVRAETKDPGRIGFRRCRLAWAFLVGTGLVRLGGSIRGRRAAGPEARTPVAGYV